MNEIWKPIDFGSGSYSISDQGQVRNNKKGIIIATQIQNSGYLICHLHYKGMRKAFTIHRLVATAFIPEIDGKIKIDHIDGNKLNNAAINLRWVTPKENMTAAIELGLLDNAAKKSAIRMKEVGSKHGFENSQKHLFKAIPLKLIIAGREMEFRSTRQASIFLKIDHKTLSNRIAKGVYKTFVS